MALTLRSLMIYNLPLLKDEINKIDNPFLDDPINKKDWYDLNLIHITHGFPWSRTPQGSDYWSEVSRCYHGARIQWPPEEKF